MNRLPTLAFLIVLAGIGWACAFGAIGFGVFARVPDNAALAAVFAGFGFAAGAACTVMRLAFEEQLPRDLVARLRLPESESREALEPLASAFGT